MANLCSQYTVYGCPASFYLNCKGYAAGKNCWEVADKRCCKENDIARCKLCSVYQKGHVENRLDPV
jgi:hypothetical protein